MIRPNSAVNGLRGFGSWYNASFRLLSDLVDCTSGKEVHPSSVEYFVRRAKDASFSLYWSLDLKHWDILRDGPPLHLIWLCERKGLNAPLETLAHLLARAIAQNHEEPAAVATLGDDGGRVKLTVWKPHQAAAETRWATVKESSIERALELGEGTGRNPFCHLIFVQPPDRSAPLPRRFHRIVLVTDDPDVRRVPRQIGSLRAILKPEVFKDRHVELPHYCAVIPTVVAQPGTSRSTAENGTRGESPVRRAAVAWWSAGRVGTEPVADEFEGPNRDPYWRLKRDLCRLPLDLNRIAERWKTTQDSAPSSFDRLVDADGRDAVSRWARAITNRQVGLALSGGGACSYRLVPLIEELLNKGVPIDVVGGVSGGALLGAYYCALGRAGLDLAVNHGPQFTLYALASVLDSRWIQYKLDYDLDAVQVEDLPTRFAAITTELRDGGRPQGSAVVRGTVGEAVRLSGSAPMEFGRTLSGRTRYTDGASTTLIPARVLRDFGADIIFACNSIPGPASSDPIRDLIPETWHRTQAAASFLTRRLPLLGRLVDGIVSAAYLVEQSSREVEEDASEYAEPEAGPLGLFEGLRFWASAELAGRDRQAVASVSKRGPGMNADPGDSPAGNRFASRWRQSRSSPRLGETHDTMPPGGRGGRRGHKQTAKSGRR